MWNVRKWILHNRCIFYLRSGVRWLPQNAKMHYNYANLMKDKNHSEAAVYHYKEAIRLWWNYPSAFNNLGTVLQQQGDDNLAEWHFAVALQLHPKHSRAAFNLVSLWR
ncbi:cellular component assembly [Halocaridina rubra]|uniref:Cellular component assembly n=1 Tax=Halocaridina rubra TaxID=373956 RepID=A0AAN8WIF9_HALRR